MPWGLAWFYCLGILLDVALGNENLEIWTLTQDKECDLTGYLRGKLQYKNRLQYMKHYFPINYRIAVPYEGVLRVANITRLQKAHVSDRELRYLWVLVSLNATESVLDVLLEGHPSWSYLQEVQTLLENVQQSLMQENRWNKSRGNNSAPGDGSQQSACLARVRTLNPHEGQAMGWRDGSVVKNTTRFSRGPEFGFQHPHQGAHSWL
ncbi:interleukin-34 isoform X3 [Apodemus sylvaticus]|uniref:interleukin-34 isoform X3 n=1 Tax=Apodemus sylvaticus TaxID=10129 RepID=UPI002244626C|nr:interleukin-34 isoform X3 [Apodemus sylvaticus]